mmetsp:Transcript_29074/g.26442  ORF Transcript_29074/g.26442 Transcript_29074/m.26442 type:complete len:163 (-) Transcript_29074:409-897(-)
MCSKKPIIIEHDAKEKIIKAIKKNEKYVPLPDMFSNTLATIIAGLLRYSPEKRYKCSIIAETLGALNHTNKEMYTPVLKESNAPAKEPVSIDNLEDVETHDLEHKNSLEAAPQSKNKLVKSEYVVKPEIQVNNAAALDDTEIWNVEADESLPQINIKASEIF